MTLELESWRFESYPRQSKRLVDVLCGSAVPRRSWSSVLKRALAVIVLLECSACSSFDRADLLHGELLVTEGSKHMLSLDSDEIYSFHIRFGENMQVYDAADEQNFKKQNRLRLMRLRRSE
jgi:hypothetical protein